MSAGDTREEAYHLPLSYILRFILAIEELLASGPVAQEAFYSGSSVGVGDAASAVAVGDPAC